VFAHQFAAVEIMVLDDELVEAFRVVRREGAGRSDVRGRVVHPPWVDGDGGTLILVGIRATA
jgi:hypothetical protein